MTRPSRLRLFVLLLLPVLLLVLLWPWQQPIRFLALAGGRQDAVGRWARWSSVRLRPSRTLAVPTRQGTLPIEILEPEAGARGTILLSSGVHSAGIREPRLRAFASSLAACRMRVVIMAPPDLTRFRLTPACTDAIEDVAIHVLKDPTLCPEGRLGLMGISFSGGLSLIAAGRPSLRDHLDYALSLGGHGDLNRVLRYLSTGEAKALPGHPCPKPHDYGAAVTLLNLAPRMVPADQVAGLEQGILTFLEASALASTDTKGAEPIFQQARALENTLPEPARSLLKKVNDRDMAALGAALRPMLSQMPPEPRLSPSLAPAPKAPVFLLHGDQDSVIPAAEPHALEEAWRSRTEVHLLVTPLIGHAEADTNGSLREIFRLLSFWHRVLS